jgi:hypothetical protein
MTTPGQDAANEAIERVEQHADPNWMAYARTTLSALVDIRERFTSDDVWDLLERSYPEVRTHERRAMGAVMRYGIRMGWCERTGEWQESNRTVCHGRPVAVYRSLVIHRQEAA